MTKRNALPARRQLRKAVSALAIFVYRRACASGRPECYAPGYVARKDREQAVLEARVAELRAEVCGT